MADTPTSLADVIVPAVFNPYMREQSVNLNAFWQSGIVRTIPDLTFGKGGGQQIQMPFWKPLTGSSQLLNDTTDLTIAKIQTGKDLAVQHARALVYGATDLSSAFAGDDPMRAIADYVGNNWSTEFTTVLLNTLNGALGSLSHQHPAVNTLDVSALSGVAGTIDGHTFIDATQTLGDAKIGIVAVGMHSAVEASLAKNDLIVTIRDSQGAVVMNTFMGKRVIVDDAMVATSGGTYSTILFGDGAVGYGEGAPKVPTETDRFALKNGGEEFLVSRRHFVLHPRGIAWAPQSGVPAGDSPSNAELGDYRNWNQVYLNKNIRLIIFKHHI